MSNKFSRLCLPYAKKVIAVMLLFVGSYIGFENAVYAAVCFLPETESGHCSIALPERSSGEEQGDQNTTTGDPDDQDLCSGYTDSLKDSRCYNCNPCPDDGNKYNCSKRTVMAEGYFMNGNDECVADPCSNYDLVARKDQNCYSCDQCESESPNNGKWFCTENMASGYELQDGVCRERGAPTGSCEDYNIVDPEKTYGDQYTACYSCTQCSDGTNNTKYKCVQRSPMQGVIGSDEKCYINVGIYCNGAGTYIDPACGGEGNRCFYSKDVKKGVKVFQCSFSQDISQKYDVSAMLSPIAAADDKIIINHKYDSIGHVGYSDCQCHNNPIYGKFPCTDGKGIRCYGTDSDGYACMTGDKSDCTANKFEKAYWCDQCASGKDAQCYYYYETYLGSEGLGFGSYPRDAHQLYVSGSKKDGVECLTSKKGGDFVVEKTSHTDNDGANRFKYTICVYRGVTGSIMTFLSDYSYAIQGDEVCTSGEKVYHDIIPLTAKVPENPRYNLITDQLMKTCSTSEIGYRYLYETNEYGVKEPVGENTEPITIGTSAYYDRCVKKTCEETVDCSALEALKGTAPDSSKAACIYSAPYGRGGDPELQCKPKCGSEWHLVLVTSCTREGYGCDGNLTPKSLGYSRCTYGCAEGSASTKCGGSTYCEECAPKPEEVEDTEIVTCLNPRANYLEGTCPTGLSFEPLCYTYNADEKRMVYFGDCLDECSSEQLSSLQTTSDCTESQTFAVECYNSSAAKEYGQCQ